MIYIYFRYYNFTAFWSHINFLVYWFSHIFGVTGSLILVPRACLFWSFLPISLFIPLVSPVTHFCPFQFSCSFLLIHFWHHCLPHFDSPHVFSFLVFLLISFCPPWFLMSHNILCPLVRTFAGLSFYFYIICVSFH